MRVALSLGVGVCLLGGCLGPLEVKEGGSGGGGGQGGAGGQGGDTCAVEFCHTAAIEGTCGPKVCPSVGWNLRFGDAANQGVSAIAVDTTAPNERIYITGRYRGTMTFGPQVVSEGGLGMDDAYLASVDGDGFGTMILNVGMSDLQDPALGYVPRVGLGVSAEGSFVYVVGSHRANEPVEPEINLDGFVRRFDPSSLQPVEWTRTFGGAGPDKAVAVAPVGSYAFVAGTLGTVPGYATEASFTCDNTVAHEVPAGEEHMVLAQYDDAGQCPWIRAFSGGTHRPTAATSNPVGDAYVTGSYVGLLVGQDGNSLPTANDDAAFVMKVDITGNVVWSVAFGGLSAGNRAVPRAITLVDGDLRVTGSMSGTVDFGTGPIVASTESTFVLALDESGTTRWVTRIGEAEGIAGMSRGTGVARAAYDGILVAIDGTASDGGDAGQGAFVANLDDAGRLRSLDFLGMGGDPAGRSLLLGSGSSAPYLAAAWSAKLRFEPAEANPAGLDVILGKFAP